MVGEEAAGERDVLDVAHALLTEEPLCNPCLGRPVADRGHGLTNAERGRALRIAIALSEDEPVTEGAGLECWVCEGVCSEYETWTNRVLETFGDIEFETYQIGSRVPPLVEENDRLLREVAELPTDGGESLKRQLNREVGKRVGRKSGTEVDFQRPDVVAVLNIERGDVDLTVNPAFVYGRYRKLQRGIPQTEWPCRECGGSGRQLGDDGGVEPCPHCEGRGYLYETSVEELIAPHVQAAMDGADTTFHGAGREDVDARMLGTGRPFVLEVEEPRIRHPELGALADRLNQDADGRIEVEGLRLATYEMVERVKDLDADKTYRAEVEFADPIEESELETALATLTGTTVEQRTPHRVSHRRADRVRRRTVHETTGELLDADHARLEIRAAGGTYIKELVSGDVGRTTPSLAEELGVDATVTDLDVIEVSGVEESFEDDAFFHD